MCDETPISCDVCYHALRFEFCLNCHVRKVTCSACAVSFSSYVKFQKHLNEHPFSHDSALECDFVLRNKKHSRLFACVICSLLFDQISALVTHERKVHETSKTYSCSYCEASYSSRVTIIHHLRIHEGEPSFECQSCDKKFHFRRLLEQHRKVHIKSDYTYECKFCGKEFGNKFVMKRHFLQHSSEKFYSCPVCTKSFLFHYSLKRHLLTHNTSDATFQCYHCEKMYMWKGDLSRHIHANHLKIKLHECKTCRKSFSRKSYLLEHQTSHSEARAHLCFCGKTFRYRSNLARHNRRTHKNLTSI